MWTFWGDAVCVVVFRVYSDERTPFLWLETAKHTLLKDHIDTYSLSVLDPRELHIEQIFSPNRFDVLTVLKALNVSASLPLVYDYVMIFLMNFIPSFLACTTDSARHPVVCKLEILMVACHPYAA